MRTILIADDSTTIRKVVQTTLGGASYKVIAVPDGRQALEKARALAPVLVLCDVLMPEMTGYEVAETLRREPQTAGIPVLLLVGAFEPFDEERASRCGALGYLAKPFEPKNLLRRVEEVLARLPQTPEAPEPIPEEPAPVHPAEAEPISSSPPPVHHLVEEPFSVPTPSESGWGPPRVPLPGDDDFDLGSLPPPVTSPLREPVSPVSMDPLREEVRRQIEQLAPDIVREVAWEVVPDLLERLLRESVPFPPSPPASGSGERSR